MQRDHEFLTIKKVKNTRWNLIFKWTFCGCNFFCKYPKAIELRTRPMLICSWSLSISKVTANLKGSLFEGYKTVCTAISCLNCCRADSSMFAQLTSFFFLAPFSHHLEILSSMHGNLPTRLTNCVYLISYFVHFP